MMPVAGRRRVAAALGAVLAQAALAHILLAQAPPDGESILRNVEAQVASIKDYTVTLDVVADIERVTVPPMHATMYYKHPEKVHIASKGFAILPRESMGLQFGGLVRRFAVDSTVREAGGAAPLYRIVLRPRDERERIRKVILWVVGGRWTPVRVLIPQADGRTMTGEFSYITVGGYALPGTLVVSFALPSQDTTRTDAGTNPLLGRTPPMGDGTRAGQRTGTITVRYSDYRLNTGLSDDLFAAPEKPVR